jgi:ABC-type antimicrobial peptide transport system permease subunit
MPSLTLLLANSRARFTLRAELNRHVLTKFVATFLYGMKPNAPVALTGAAVTLLVAAAVAGYVPARRASRIDAMTALRHE